MLKYVIAEHPLLRRDRRAPRPVDGPDAAAWKSTKQIVARASAAFMNAALLLNPALKLLRWHRTGACAAPSLFVARLRAVHRRRLPALRAHPRTRVFGLPAMLLAFGSHVRAREVGRRDREAACGAPVAVVRPHVMVYFVGYAAVALAFVLAIIQLLTAPRVMAVQRLLSMKAGLIMSGKPLDVETMSYELVRTASCSSRSASWSAVLGEERRGATSGCGIRRRTGRS